eukprot:Hpha_TRINITY_DN18812_c0_g1::TRINITY_DN18812_c0_g1_i1::g.26187::m.26187
MVQEDSGSEGDNAPPPGITIWVTQWGSKSASCEVEVPPEATHDDVIQLCAAALGMDKSRRLVLRDSVTHEQVVAGGKMPSGTYSVEDLGQRSKRDCDVALVAAPLVGAAAGGCGAAVLGHAVAGIICASVLAPVGAVGVAYAAGAAAGLTGESCFNNTPEGGEEEGE